MQAFSKASLALLLIISITALHELGVIDAILNTSEAFVYLTAFVAGFFFTSMFTIGPASITLFELLQRAPLPQVVLLGGLGALLGDLVIIRSLHAVGLDAVKKKIVKKYKLVRLILNTKPWSYLSSFFGAIIIASPLPDEVGLTLLGVTKINPLVLALLLFCANAFGILLLSLGLSLV